MFHLMTANYHFRFALFEHLGAHETVRIEGCEDAPEKLILEIPGLIYEHLDAHLDAGTQVKQVGGGVPIIDENMPTFLDGETVVLLHLLADG